jgi:hypothetical protein
VLTGSKGNFSIYIHADLWKWSLRFVCDAYIAVTGARNSIFHLHYMRAASFMEEKGKVGYVHAYGCAVVKKERAGAKTALFEE